MSHGHVTVDNFKIKAKLTAKDKNIKHGIKSSKVRKLCIYIGYVGRQQHTNPTENQAFDISSFQNKRIN